MSETKEVRADEVEQVQMMINAMNQLPPEQLRDMRRHERMKNRVWKYLQDNGRTMKEEYELILAKESGMSRGMRDFLQGMMEYVPSEEEIALAEARKKRVEAMQEEE